MTPTIKPHILCVDDEPQVLESLKLNLRRLYVVSTASSGPEALTLLDQACDIAVIVSDMRMPQMNGAVFLAKARQKAPDAIRLLLTGHSDIDAAIAAVNDGQIFRFLTKPCAPMALLDAVASAVAQHRLVTSERVLLEQTLHGSIKALTDLLALVNPIAFGRSMRIAQLVKQLADQIHLKERWQLEVAAMLSQIGHVTLPEQVAEKAYYDLPMSQDEERLIQGLPVVVDKLLSNIPRLDVVLAILRNCKVGQLTTSDAAQLDAAQALVAKRGVEILKLAIDCDILESASGTPFHSVIRTLRSRAGVYATDLIDALDVVRNTEVAPGICTLTMRDLNVGMVFAEDVKAPNGVLLVARGYQITQRVLERMDELFPAKNSQVQWAVYR